LQKVKGKKTEKKNPHAKPQVHSFKVRLVIFPVKQAYSNLSSQGTNNTKYDKQDRQGKVAFNERSPHPTQQQAPAARSPGGLKKKGQGRARAGKPLHKNK
jgi:hypothetical protein